MSRPRNYLTLHCPRSWVQAITRTARLLGRLLFLLPWRYGVDVSRRCKYARARDRWPRPCFGARKLFMELEPGRDVHVHTNPTACCFCDNVPDVSNLFWKVHSAPLLCL